MLPQPPGATGLSVDTLRWPPPRSRRVGSNLLENLVVLGPLGRVTRDGRVEACLQLGVV